MGEVLDAVERGRVRLLHVVLVNLDHLVVAVQLNTHLTMMMRMMIIIMITMMMLLSSFMFIVHLALCKRFPCLALLDLTTGGKAVPEIFYLQFILFSIGSKGHFEV